MLLATNPHSQLISHLLRPQSAGTLRPPLHKRLDGSQIKFLVKFKCSIDTV